MGKTVGAILLVAAAIAVNVIPGVGQAISAALISAGLTAAAAASITAAIGTALIGAALGAVGGLFGPSLKPPETMAQALKTPTPPRVSAYGQSRLYGAYILFSNSLFNTTSDTFAPWGVDVFAIHDGPIDSIVGRYLGDDAITRDGGGFVNTLANKQYQSDTVKWMESLGTTPGTANFADIISKVPGEWSANHRGDGVVCIGIVWKPVKSENFPETFPNGTPPASIVAKWQKVYDPRDVGQDVSDPATWEWSENAVLHLLHYRLVREKARRISGAVFPTAGQLQDAWDLFFAPTVGTWLEAADVCDEAVALAAGGTEPRYRSSFAHKHTDPHKDVIEALTATFDGWVSPRADGALVVYAGKYQAPTVTIGPAEIVNYSWQYGVVDEEAVNEVKLTYISPTQDYNVVDVDPWQDLNDIAARGQFRTQGLDFQIPSAPQARRLAKRMMYRIMANNRGVVTTNVAGRIVRGQRYIYLQIIEGGATFFDGVAEITSLSRNISTGGVTFSWVEASPDIDDWDAATEEGNPAPGSTPTIVIAPSTPVISSTGLVFDQPINGQSGVRVNITLAGPHGDDLTWLVRWRKTGATTWVERNYSDIDSSGSVVLITDFVPTGPGVTVDVQVAYRSGSGARSSWSATSVVSTDTSATAPDAAGTVTLEAWEGRITVSTPAIARAASYRWRFYEADNTTLARELFTPIPLADYTSSQAVADGIQREYYVEVTGVNGGGVGTPSARLNIDKPAPGVVTSVAFADGTYNTVVTFDTPVAGAAGYYIAYATAAGFDPVTQGSSFFAGTSPAYSGNLAASTYYGKVGAYDEWASRPDLINFSAEDSFVISTGSGAPPGGDGGGGYAGGGGGSGRDTGYFDYD